MKKASIRSSTIVRKILIWRKAWHWTRYYLKLSGTFQDENDTDSARARLRKDAHALEKGLSLPEVRPFYGRSKIEKLIKDICSARAHSTLNNDREIAEAVLGAYAKWHIEKGHVDPFIETLRAQFPGGPYQAKIGGTVPLEKSDNQNWPQDFDNVILSRRTVRNFSEVRVPLKEIESAVRVAGGSPSVCNRQPWAVSIVQDKKRIARLLLLQAGNRGFSESIDTLLIVFADTKAFVEDYEIFEPFVDAGIFSGVLVNALHARGIGSCCLNLCVSHHVAEQIIAESGTSRHLFPIMMIGCGYPQDDCEVAISARGPSAITS